jgi:hypothetical protein
MSFIKLTTMTLEHTVETISLVNTVARTPLDTYYCCIFYSLGCPTDITSDVEPGTPLEF